MGPARPKRQMQIRKRLLRNSSRGKRHFSSEARLHMPDCLLLHPVGAQSRLSRQQLPPGLRLYKTAEKGRERKMQGFPHVTLVQCTCLSVAKACHLTTCRVLAPRNPRQRGKTRPRDAPISVDMLGNRLLGCASKFYRTNPAKDTLSAYLLGQAGMLDDTGARYVLSVLLFSGIWNHSLRKSFHLLRHPAEPTKSRLLRRLTTSFE